MNQKTICRNKLENATEMRRTTHLAHAVFGCDGSALSTVDEQNDNVVAAGICHVVHEQLK
jgi:hypothetical protein